jgi:flagellar protein FliS
MQGYLGPKAANQYLAQRLESASPEQVMAILLEGGQKYLAMVLAAMKVNDIPSKARYANRVSDFILEMTLRLNRKEGGEVVANLDRIYKWWTDEMYAGARKNQPARLELVLEHMGEMRAMWEERHRMNLVAHKPMVSATSLDLMVG